MIFNSLSDAKNFYRQYKDLEDGDYDLKISGYYQSSSKIDLKFGQYILFKHIKFNGNRRKISRPILALFLGYNIWDQALVIEFVEDRESYMSNHEVITNKEMNYSMTIDSLDIQTEQIQFWTDDIILLGYWNSKPDWKILKEILIKTSPIKYKRKYILNNVIND